jgi:hypothetical protein
MERLTRNMILVVWCWLMLAGTCFSKQVYLRDGAIVEAQSVRMRGDLVVVTVNRDTVVEFLKSEVDLSRTFHPGAKRKHRHGHKKSCPPVSSRADVASAGAVAAGSKPANPSAVPKPVQTAPTPAPKPAPPVAQPSPPQAPVAKPQPTPVAQPIPAPAAMPAKAETPPEAAAKPSAEPAPSMTKDEREKVRKEAAEMMAEAIRKNDPELMKKAVELQKSTLPQKPGQVNASAPGAAGIGMSFLLGILVVSLLIVVSLWVVYEKCDQAGWKSLIPFYNMYVMMVICEKPVWWFLLLFIPFVGTVFYLLAMIALAEKFGKGALFGVGLTFLPMIFLPLLAFGGAKPQEFTFA